MLPFLNRNIEISGKITDAESGKPVAQAIISTNNSRYSTTSSDEGTFKFHVLLFCLREFHKYPLPHPLHSHDPQGTSGTLHTPSPYTFRTVRLASPGRFLPCIA